MLGLEHVTPIQPDALHPMAGFGRVGTAPAGWSVAHLSQHIAGRLGVKAIQVAGDVQRPAGRVGIVCGSGGDSLDAVRQAGCATFLTGELKLHQAIEARAPQRSPSGTMPVSGFRWRCWPGDWPTMWRG